MSNELIIILVIMGIAGIGFLILNRGTSPEKISSDTKKQEKFVVTDEVTFIFDPNAKLTHHGCGHEALSPFNMNLYGRVVEVTSGVFCVECAKKEIQKWTRCGLCGLEIMTGEGVATYIAGDDPSFRKDAKRIGNIIIGCLRDTCCPTGAAQTGHWTDEGYKPLFQSGNSVAGEALIGTKHSEQCPEKKE
jgi:hypothetical protein